jgi:hypothetical protein
MIAPAAALGLITAATAAAQPTGGEVEQIGADAGAPAEVGQISQGPRTIMTPVVTPPEPIRSAPQVSTRGDSRRATPQLTDERSSGQAPVQLYRGGRTALPAEPLSRPSDGRTAAVARVEGEDRCDPARREAGEPRVCERVIETRAGEFRRAEPALSAEEKLLVEQRLREQQASAEAAAQRLAANAGNPDSLDEQSIAAVVLSDPQPLRDAAAEAGAPADSGSLAEAIAVAVTGAPPAPQ